MPSALARQLFKVAAEHHKLTRNEMKEYTSTILERAEYLNENWHWLFNEDKGDLAELVEKIEELSDTVLERNKSLVESLNHDRRK